MKRIETLIIIKEAIYAIILHHHGKVNFCLFEQQIGFILDEAI
jgi:hypothetical protein